MLGGACRAKLTPPLRFGCNIPRPRPWLYSPKNLSSDPAQDWTADACSSGSPCLVVVLSPTMSYLIHRRQIALAVFECTNTTNIYIVQSIVTHSHLPRISVQNVGPGIHELQEAIPLFVQTITRLSRKARGHTGIQSWRGGMSQSGVNIKKVNSHRRAHLPTKECCAPGARESVEDGIFPVRCFICIPRQGFSGHLTRAQHTRGGMPHNQTSVDRFSHTLLDKQVRVQGCWHKSLLVDFFDKCCEDYQGSPSTHLGESCRGQRYSEHIFSENSEFFR